MNGLRGFFKAAQRHTFTLLNTRWGFLLLVVASLLCFNAAISSIDAFFHISELPLPAQYDNIAGKDFSEFVCGEPIDVVYTWVNGSDPWMQYNLRRYRALAEMMPGEVVNGTAMEEEEASIEEGSDTGKSRYQDNQELRYSIRSVERFAGWVRHIYLVTNGQVPHWLNVDHPKITVVPHHDLYPNKSHLPVFASPTIESHLHRIPGLSRRFIYLNDDTFFGKTIHPDDFATHTEGHRVFLSWAVPNCAEGCPGTWVADGYCDKPCNTSECDWDGGDCVGANVKQGVGAPSSSHVAPGPPGEPTGCSSGCVPSWVGDKFCDRNCNNRECGYDATDCSLDDLRTLPMIHAGYDEYVLDADEPAAVMNLTAVFDEHSRVTSGSHDSSELLWTTTVSQLHKMLVIVVKTHRFASVRRPHTATVHFDLLGKEGDGTDIWYSFNVTLVARNGTHEDLDDYLPEERQAYQRQRSTGGDATSLDSAPLDTIPEEGPRRKLQQWSGVQLRESTSVRNSIGVLEGFTADDVAVATARRGLKGKVEAQEYVKEALSRLVPPRGTETTEWRRMKRRRLAQKLLQREMQRHEEEASWKRIESFWAFVEGTSPEPSDSPSPNGRRLLLDMFGESLKYANRLMNARFGNAARKVPSHMPHFLNQDVLREVQDAWKKEYEATSASRFRAGNNMQLAFTHMYWLMHAKNEKNAFLLFLDNLDINGNGLLDVLEYRRAAVILWEKKVPLEDLKAVFDSPAAAPSNRTGENATLTSTATATMTVVDEPSELTMSMMTPAVEMTPVVQETNVYGVTEGDVDRVLPEDDGGDANTTEAGDLPPLLCRNETVAGANGSEVVREICEREVPKMATVETPAPPSSLLSPSQPLGHLPPRRRSPPCPLSTSAQSPDSSSSPLRGLVSTVPPSVRRPRASSPHCTSMAPTLLPSF
eukprot:Sspe_Gene.82282::Locus_53927_Transcript_1_1_Confidence_1.000_Length_3562::g.82282::m.82282/K08239/GNPTAB; UDP-N-acetylglucosamine-lysosomal-enzyme